MPGRCAGARDRVPSPVAGTQIARCWLSVETGSQPGGQAEPACRHTHAEPDAHSSARQRTWPLPANSSSRPARRAAALVQGEVSKETRQAAAESQHSEAAFLPAALPEVPALRVVRSMARTAVATAAGSALAALRVHAVRQAVAGERTDSASSHFQQARAPDRDSGRASWAAVAGSSPCKGGASLQVATAAQGGSDRMEQHDGSLQGRYWLLHLIDAFCGQCEDGRSLRIKTDNAHITQRRFRATPALRPVVKPLTSTQLASLSQGATVHLQQHPGGT